MNNALSIISNICVGDKYSNRENILCWEKLAKTKKQIEIPVKHTIHAGMYSREITIPADTIITGQIYKFDHLDIMISGDITVSTDTGEVKRFTGYNSFKGMAGKKRAGYAHKDTTWVTVHPFTGKNGDEIQKFITAESFEELQDFNVLLNRSDYRTMVDSLEMTEEEIKKQVENKNDLIDMPIGYLDLYVDDSSINGRGLYSKKFIPIDAFICPARIKDKRTLAGRFTNHALQPNAKMIVNDNGVDLVSIKDIEAEEEITVNYRDVLTNRYIRGDLSCQE